MCDMCSRSSSSKCCTAGVGKKIQYFDRTPGIFKFFQKTSPSLQLVPGTVLYA